MKMTLVRMKMKTILMETRMVLMMIILLIPKTSMILMSRQFGMTDRDDL